MNGLYVSPSPHRTSGITTAKIMLTVIISLIPAAAAGAYYFGSRAASGLLICVASCVGFEALAQWILKREQSVYDLSAVVTGLLLGMNLPATVPFYVAVIGSFVAIVVVKQLFGGIGQNFANPAIAARIVLLLSFAGSMTDWVQPFWYKNNVDAVTGATPLAAQWLTYTEGGAAYKMAP